MINFLCATVDYLQTADRDLFLKNRGAQLGDYVKKRSNESVFFVVQSR
jgi:hypothetical protein